MFMTAGCNRRSLLRLSFSVHQIIDAIILPPILAISVIQDRGMGVHCNNDHLLFSWVVRIFLQLPTYCQKLGCYDYGWEMYRCGQNCSHVFFTNHRD